MDSRFASFYSRNSVLPGPLGQVDALGDALGATELSADRVPGVLAPLPVPRTDKATTAAEHDTATAWSTAVTATATAPARMLYQNEKSFDDLFGAGDDGLPDGSLPYAAPELAVLRGAAVLPNSFASTYHIHTLPDDLLKHGSVNFRKERCGCGGPKLKSN